MSVILQRGVCAHHPKPDNERDGEQAVLHAERRRTRCTAGVSKNIKLCGASFHLTWTCLAGSR